MNEDLTGLTVSSTYHRLVQVINNRYYDGIGNELNITNGGSGGTSSQTNICSIDGGYPDSFISGGVFKIDFGGVI